MTKATALREFRALYDGPKGDKPAKAEAWNNYIDFLCKDRLITKAQAETWDNPFYF